MVNARERDVIAPKPVSCESCRCGSRFPMDYVGVEGRRAAVYESPLGPRAGPEDIVGVSVESPVNEVYDNPLCLCIRSVESHSAARLPHP